MARGEPAGSGAKGAPKIIDIILDCLDEHKAVDVVNIDLEGKSTIADNMVIATGTSTRQVAALAEHLLRRLKDVGIVGITPEGLRQGDWVLIDAGDAIVHLFRPEIRAFYNIEKMWGASAPDESESGESESGESESGESESGADEPPPGPD